MSTAFLFMPELTPYRAYSTRSLNLPLYSSPVRAGFPSPADDYIDKYLDLNDYLVPHPAATFFVKAEGGASLPGGIQQGDLLIVDRSLTATHRDIIIASIAGDLSIKRLYKKNGLIKLTTDNITLPPITITGNLDLVIWGVVRHIIHTPKKCIN